jgi:hypothetical protein
MREPPTRSGLHATRPNFCNGTLIALGRSYRLIGREVGLSKNTVADIVKRSRITADDA